MKPAPPVTTKTSVTARIVSGQRGGTEPGARPLILLPRRREDVQDHAAYAERAAAVRHVGRRLPEFAGLHVVLDPILDAGPLAFETHAPLLVGVRVERRNGARLERDHGQHRRARRGTLAR